MKANNSRVARRGGALITSALALCLCGGTLLAADVPLSELLEKGIYSEETKGDLDAAMQFYRQVASGAKAGQALGAQAQYRLGLCYYKKKDYASASAAFTKLLRDFPDQKELGRQAREYLAGTQFLLPAPWTDGEELQMDLSFSTGFKLGTVRFWVNAGQANGRKTWRLRSRLYAGVHQVSTVEVDADTFKPIRSHWKHGLLGSADAVYERGQVSITRPGKEQPQSTELDPLVYDNEEVIQLLRRMPLETNYCINIGVLTSLGGGNVIPLGITVAGRESVTVPAGTFDCYKVELSLRQTFWYSTDPHRYLVKFEAGGVAAELTAVVQTPAGAPEVYKDATLSVTAPFGWTFFVPQTKEQNLRESLVALDPEAQVLGGVRLRGLESLPANGRKSARAWAELVLAEQAGSKKDLKARENSWQEQGEAGQSSVACLADYTDGADKKVLYYRSAFRNAEVLDCYFEAPAEEFLTLQPGLDAIFNSIKILQPEG